MADSDSNDTDKQDAAAPVAAEAVKAAPQKSARGGKNTATLGNYLINCNEPIDVYSNGPVKAYGAGLKKTGGSGMFALVCERHYTPRFRDMERYEATNGDNCVSLKKRGVVYWPPAKQERYVLIYEGGIGQPLLPPGFSMHMGLKQDVVLERIAKPLIRVLQDFQNKNVVHGAIRVENIFDGGGRDMKDIVLGDAMSVPPSSTQPVLYETIERGMADPLSRGLGTTADDLYALGITLAVLMRQNDPMAGMSDHQIVRHKIEHGSYLTVTGKDRFTGSILELLRGLLHDDEGQRWTIEEVLLWMDGQRLSPKQTTKAKKAMRPFKFNKKQYFQPSVLAMDLHENLSETVSIVTDGRLLQWVERSVEDAEALERLEIVVALSASKSKSSDYSELLASLLSSAMDTVAPVRYCGMAIGSGGVGARLSAAVALKHDVKPFVDLFLKDVIFKWLDANTSSALDKKALGSLYDDCRRSLRQGTMGYGVERCVYILNEHSLCYSEKLSEYHVTKPEDLLDAIEDQCTKNELEGLILDRHMVAFLSKNESRVVDPFLFDLNSAEYHQNIIGNLKVFAAMQERFSVASLPGVARVLHNMLPAVLKRYHDKEVREELRQGAKRYMKSGDVVKMSAIFSNTSTNKKDHRAFLEAMQEYASLEKKHNGLKDGMDNSSNFGKSTGQDVAALFSCVLSFLIVCLIAFSFF